MTVFEVCMLILGLVLIGVSFFFTEKVTSKGKKEEATNAIIGLDEEHLLVIQNTVEENLEKISEATIVKTENDLNKVTNEKIMAISEYSEQILEKIEQNHMEVVFLYNMLNEKENAMKENYCKKENKTEYTESKSKDLENQTDTNNSTVIDSKVTEPERYIQGINDEEAAMLVNNTNYSYIEQEFTDEDNQNNNQEIMKLYAQGKSITEIAKTLDLGKGEVSFVINLNMQN